MEKRHIVTRVLLSNWWSYHNTIFDMSKWFIYFIGGNGSGKTTFFDAMSLVWYGEDTNKLNYTSPDKRSAAGSVHWGTGTDAKRPGRTYSYIILEAKDMNGRTYHQGIRYMSKAGSEKIDESVYFWDEGTLESIGANDPIVTDRGEVVMNRNNRTTDRRSAFKAFFERRGYLESFCRTTINNKDPHIRFREYCRSILSNEKINESSFSEYIKTSIFPPTMTGEEYSELSDTIRKLDEMKVIDSENRRKLHFLQNVFEKGRTYIETSEKLAFEMRMAPYINVRYYSQETARLRELVSEKEEAARDLEEQIRELAQKHDELVSSLAVLENSEDEEKRARDRLERARYELREKEHAYNDHNRYVSASEVFVESIPELGEPGEEHAPGQIIEAAENYISEKEKELDSVRGTVQTINSRIRELESNISALRGHASGADATNATAQMKADADALKACIARDVPGSDPRILYECISDIKDEEWQDAAEGLIGNSRFGIIVAPEYYDRACIRQHRFSGNTRDVIVLNTKTASRPAQPGSLPGLFEYSSEYAKLFVESAYGAYILCGTDDEYTRNAYALRKNGQYKTPKSSIKPGLRKKVVRMFGSEAVKKQIDKWNAEKEEQVLEKTRTLTRASFQKQRLDFLRKEYNALQSCRRYADPSVEKEYHEAEQSFREAEKDLAEVLESDQVKAKERKREEYLALLQENTALNEAKTSEKNAVMVEYAGYRDEEGKASGYLSAFQQSMKDYREPTEEDWEKAEKTGILVSLRGNANVNQRKTLLEERLAASRSDMNNAFSANPEMLDKFVGLPESVRNRRDLDAIEDSLVNVRSAVLSEQSKRGLDKLQRAVQQSYCLCLQRVYQEYTRAQELRSGINSILGRYQIGKYFYRLGPIIDMADPDADILELARLQTQDGVQLDDKQTETLNTVCRKAFDAGWNPFDYRRYIATDLQCRDSSSSGWRNADKTTKGSSNGQQGILRYLFKILVLYSQAFEDKSLNLIISDEVLQGVDDINSRYFFDLLKELGVQCLIATFDNRFVEYADMTYVCETVDDNIRTHIFKAKET